jgi:hypothetical protein
MNDPRYNEQSPKYDPAFVAQINRRLLATPMGQPK